MQYLVKVKNICGCYTFSTNAENSRKAAYKIFQTYKEKGYKGNWVDFRKRVISARREK